jgi:hypothetical protein
VLASLGWTAASSADATFTETLSGTVTNEYASGVTCTVAPCPTLVGDSVTFVITIDPAALVSTAGPNHSTYLYGAASPTGVAGMTVSAMFTNGSGAAVTLSSPTFLSSNPSQGGTGPGNGSGAGVVTYTPSSPATGGEPPSAQTVEYQLASNAVFPGSPPSQFELTVSGNLWTGATPGPSTAVTVPASPGVSGGALLEFYNPAGGSQFLLPEISVALSGGVSGVAPPPVATGSVYFNIFQTGSASELSWSNNGVVGSTPSNWSSSATSYAPVAPPLAGQDVFLVGSGSPAGANTTMYFDGSYPTVALNSLTIDQTGGGTMTLVNGANPLAATTETIGANGSGALVQTGGSNSTTLLTLAQNPGSAGTYSLQGGTLSANTIQVNAGGTFQFQGGAVKFAQFNLSGGAVTASGNEFLDMTGQTGSYMVVQSGASSNTAAGVLLLGGNTNVYGVYQLNGGTVVTGGEVVGGAGAALFDQAGNGTSNTVNGNLVVGSLSNGVGQYNLRADSLTGAVNSLVAQNEIIGSNGSGFFDQTSNTANSVTGTLTVAEFSGGAHSSYALQGGALAANAIQINSGGTFTESAAFDVSGNALPVSLLANTIQVANGGTFTQSGGSANVGALSVGGAFNLQGGSLSAGSIAVAAGGSFAQSGGIMAYGTFALNGASSGFTSGNPVAQVTTTGNEYIGTTASLAASNPTSSFIQNGSSDISTPSAFSSTHTVSGALVLGRDGGTTGIYALNGGSLSAAVEEIGFQGTGTFTQTGGLNAIGPYDGTTRTLVTSSNGLASANELNGTLTIGSQPGSAGTYNLQGGLLTAGVVNVNGGGSFVLTGGSAALVSANTTNAGSLSITNSTFDTGSITNTGQLTVSGATGLLQIGTCTGGVCSGAFLQTLGATVLNGGSIDPTTLTITGGSFGGTGTVVGDLSISNGATLNVGGPTPGILNLQGNLTQSGGAIDFLMGDGSSSALALGAGDGATVTGTSILLDFTDGAAETAFLGSGEVALASLFEGGTGLDFTGDTFAYEIGAGGALVDLNLVGGDLTVESGATGVPEPSTLALLLPGLGIVSLAASRRRRPMVAPGARAA